MAEDMHFLPTIATAALMSPDEGADTDKVFWTLLATTQEYCVQHTIMHAMSIGNHKDSLQHELPWHGNTPHPHPM